jgi:hypothetical protein
VISDAFKSGAWSELEPFVYRDGSTMPPLLLRDIPEQNYLSSGLRIFGLILMGFNLMASIVSIIWVYINREHRVLRAAQPPFLYVLVVGAMVCSLAILTISFDESCNGWTTEQLSRACMATPWFLSVRAIADQEARSMRRIVRTYPFYLFLFRWESLSSTEHYSASCGG